MAADEIDLQRVWAEVQRTGQPAFVRFVEGLPDLEPSWATVTSSVSFGAWLDGPHLIWLHDDPVGRLLADQLSVQQLLRPQPQLVVVSGPGADRVGLPTMGQVGRGSSQGPCVEPTSIHCVERGWSTEALRTLLAAAADGLMPQRACLAELLLAEREEVVPRSTNTGWRRLELGREPWSWDQSTAPPDGKEALGAAYYMQHGHPQRGRWLRVPTPRTRLDDFLEREQDSPPPVPDELAAVVRTWQAHPATPEDGTAALKALVSAGLISHAFELVMAEDLSRLIPHHPSPARRRLSENVWRALSGRIHELPVDFARDVEESERARSGGEQQLLAMGAIRAAARGQAAVASYWARRCGPPIPGVGAARLLLANVSQIEPTLAAHLLGLFLGDERPDLWATRVLDALVCEGPVLGDYVLVRPLAEGGMGEVWLGRHLTLDHPVVVKLVRPIEGDVLEAFEQEIAVSAGLDHPAIVQVLDQGRVDVVAHHTSGGRFVEGASFLVLEWVDGGALSKRCGETTPEETRDVCATLLDALHYVHTHDVVHRDVKPDNVLVGVDGIRLADFGIASLDARAGTPLYMAPEQFKRAGVGCTVDVYAVGGLAYALVTGAPPFEGSVAELDVLHHSCPVPADPRLPTQLFQWIVRLMAKRPADRPSAKEALDQLNGLDLSAMEPTEVGLDSGSTFDFNGASAPAADETAVSLPTTWPPLHAVRHRLPTTRLAAFGDPPFCGHARVRRSLWRLAQRAVETRSVQRVALVGAPGTGRRTLVRWLASQARQAGVELRYGTDPTDRSARVFDAGSAPLEAFTQVAGPAVVVWTRDAPSSVPRIRLGAVPAIQICAHLMEVLPIGLETAWSLARPEWARGRPGVAIGSAFDLARRAALVPNGDVLESLPNSLQKAPTARIPEALEHAARCAKTLEQFTGAELDALFGAPDTIDHLGSLVARMPGGWRVAYGVELQPTSRLHRQAAGIVADGMRAEMHRVLAAEHRAGTERLARQILEVLDGAGMVGKRPVDVLERALVTAVTPLSDPAWRVVEIAHFVTSNVTAETLFVHLRGLDADWSSRFLLAAARVAYRQQDFAVASGRAARAVNVAESLALRTSCAVFQVECLRASGHVREALQLARTLHPRVGTDAYTRLERGVALSLPNPRPALERLLSRSSPASIHHVHVALSPVCAAEGDDLAALEHALEGRRGFVGLDGALMDLNFALGLTRMGRLDEARRYAEDALGSVLAGASTHLLRMGVWAHLGLDVSLPVASWRMLSKRVPIPKMDQALDCVQLWADAQRLAGRPQVALWLEEAFGLRSESAG